MELDHVFILCDQGAPEAEALLRLGIREGSRNTHPGQGTACRRFFFCNAYLELLWVTEPLETQSEAIRPTHLWERWVDRTNGACPFGLGFRPAVRGAGGVPFPAWEFRPPYWPASSSAQVATNADVLTEPMMFYLFFGQRPDAYPDARHQMMEHAAGLREITRIEFVSPNPGSPSPALEALANAKLVQLRRSGDYSVELGFDGELQGRLADFRPDLPLVFRW